MSDSTSQHLDLSETSRAQDGRVHKLDRRLFMQLLAYGGCLETPILIESLQQSGLTGALYEDINDPQGVALLIVSEDPGLFVGDLRRFLSQKPFCQLQPKPEYTMLGRTYALGYEQDLEETLVHRPLRKVINPNFRWAIWYPLRRAGSFEQLSGQDQRVVLAEHGGIGMAFGRAGYGTDIRLACFGLDKNDNDFVVGILGPELFPLSAIVQRMRKTKQTSQYLERLGPFFVGRVAWQSGAANA
jgi:chlorite dismutase